MALLSERRPSRKSAENQASCGCRACDAAARLGAGVLAQAFFEAGDDDNVILLTKASMVQRVADGRLGVVDNGSPTDPAMGGQAYRHAAEITGESEIRDAVLGMLEWILHKAPHAPDGTLYHIFEGPQVWSDG